MDPGRTARAPDAPHAREAAEVAQHLDVDPAVGLTKDQVRHRLARHGPNVIPRRPRDSLVVRIAQQFSNLLVGLLVAAAVVAWVSTKELTTPAVVIGVVVANAVLGLVQEQRANSSLAALGDLLAPQATVVRQASLAVVEASQIAPGDVIAVEAGDKVPADARIWDAWNLEVDESALTGESLPVAKAADRCAVPSAAVADRTSMLHKGTVVTKGRGRAVVTATGLDTQIGAIARSLSSIEAARSPLQRQLDGLGRHLAGLAGAVVALVSVVGFVRGQPASEVALTAVALAVASIPEGLPAVTAVTLAVGARRLAAQNAIVSSLGDVETLGATSVICTDKTGTVTGNQMVATVAASAHGVCRIADGLGTSPSALPLAALETAALCSDADGTGAGAGDPTERALLAMALDAGIDTAALARTHRRIAELPFDSANKFMATVHSWPHGEDTHGVRLLVKGAPDVVLARASHVAGSDGRCRPLDHHDATTHSTRRGRVAELAATLAGSGLRVIALAHRDIPGWQMRAHDGAPPASVPDRVRDLVDDLVVDALVGISDPPRPEVVAAVAEAHRAGIEVKLITGDHPRTASAVAAEIGLRSADCVLSGIDIDGLDDTQLSGQAEEASVFARVDPGHKLRIVEALRGRGRIVAMTGDGVNDAPALRSADIGVAMGVAGTDVARDAARMVLADDNFATIVHAVRHGRIIHDNVVKFVQFQVTTTVGFAMLFVLAGLVGVADGSPMSPLAILLVNVVMDGPPALALGLDSGDESVMDRPPRTPGSPILGPELWRLVLASSAVMALGTLAVAAAAPEPRATTAAFNTFVCFQLVHLVVVHLRGRRVDGRTVFSNPMLWVSVASVVALQVAVTHYRALGRTFDTVPLGALEWATCAGVALLLAAMECARRAMPHLPG